MRRLLSVFAAIVLLTVVAGGCSSDRAPAPAKSGERFRLTSPDLAKGNAFPADAYANIFGCSGSNHAPTLRWHGAPPATKSFALTIHDVDAPRKGGFWHLALWDVPASASAVSPTTPKGAVEGLNDAGKPGYLGPCPPPGDGTHRYVIDVYALDVRTLGMRASTVPAKAVPSIRQHVIGTAELVATAAR